MSFCDYAGFKDKDAINFSRALVFSAKVCALAFCVSIGLGGSHAHVITSTCVRMRDNFNVDPLVVLLKKLITQMSIYVNM